jgi:serine/threonine-protein kinase
VYSLGVVLGDLVAGRSDRDLDAIIAKARAAAPADRYAAVSEFAADIERWLQRRPVQARPASLGYSALRLLQRRWPAFAAGAAFLVTVGVLGVQLAGQRNRALDAEVAARREAAAAQAVSGFLTDLFHGADVDEGGARDTSALALVDRGRDRLERELAAAPGTQAQLGAVLAGVYASLGEPQQAATLYARALVLERAQRPPRPALLTRLLIDYSALELHRDRAAEAQPPAREALALVESSPTPRPRDHIDALSALAAVDAQLGQFDDADQLLARALALQEVEHDPPHVLALTWYAQAQNAVERGDLDAALAKLTPTLAALRAHYGDLHPHTLDALEAIAVVHGRKERLDEAEAMLRDALAKRLQVHGERSSKVSSVQGELAFLLNLKGEYIESAALNEKVLAHDAAVQGRESPVYARTLNNLAFAYQNMGDAERCIAAFRESLAIREKTLPAGDLAIARARNNLARFLTWLGRVDESGPLVAAALAARSAQLPEGHEERLESEVATMELQRRAGDLAGARARWDRIEPLLAKSHPYTQLEAKRARAWLAASDKDRDTRRYIAAYIDGLRATLGAKNPSVLRGRVAEAEMLEAWGDHPAAVGLAKELRAQFSALPAAYPPTSIFYARLARIAP